LKVQETLYALLTSQYEQAKIAEARDTPTVQVLDPPVPADKQIKGRVLRSSWSMGWRRAPEEMPVCPVDPAEIDDFSIAMVESARFVC